MNCFKISVIVVLFSIIITAPRANAQVEKSLVGIGGGIAGILDDHKILLGSVEYRPKLELIRLQPWMGVDFGYDLFYLAGGLLTHIKLTENYILTPSFGVGLYSHKGGIKLGSPVEFKSKLELNYRIKNNRFLGISFSHISNGGIDEKNPGAELVTICYYLPLPK